MSTVNMHVRYHEDRAGWDVDRAVRLVRYSRYCFVLAGALFVVLAAYSAGRGRTAFAVSMLVPALCSFAGAALMRRRREPEHNPR